MGTAWHTAPRQFREIRENRFVILTGRDLS